MEAHETGQQMRSDKETVKKEQEKQNSQEAKEEMTHEQQEKRESQEMVTAE